jgi:hypothetical protein
MSAFTRVFDALWRNAGRSIPDFASLHPGYKKSYTTTVSRFAARVTPV